MTDRRQELTALEARLECRGRAPRIFCPAEADQRLQAQGLALFRQPAVLEPTGVLDDGRQGGGKILPRHCVARPPLQGLVAGGAEP